MMQTSKVAVGDATSVKKANNPTGANAIDLWNQVVLERGKPFGEEFWSAKSVEQLDLDDLILYQIEEITYEEDAPRIEALENALSCMTVPGMNLVYLILGDGENVRFYFGVARDYISAQDESGTVKEIGDSLLRPALEGNFRGSIVRELDVDANGNRTAEPKEKKAILETLRKYMKKAQNCRVLSGVPGGVRDKANRDMRGVDRLVDIMQGDRFGMMILAKAIDHKSLADLRLTVFKAYEMLSIAAKQSVQVGHNEGTNKQESDTHGSGSSHTKGTSESTGHSDSRTEKRGESNSATKGGSKTEGKNVSDTTSKNESKTQSEGSQQGSSVTVSADVTNKIAADWIKYFDDVIVPRLDYARGKGAYVVSTALLGENPNVVRKLSQAAKSIFAGEMANMVPLETRVPSPTECRQLENMTIPYHLLSSFGAARLPYAEAGLLEFAGMARAEKGANAALDQVLYSGNWMSVRELALMAGLPQKEVVGLRLKEEVEFGLNVPKGTSGADDDVRLGALVKSGNVCRKSEIRLGSDQLDRHVFVAGVTGSGKTTTCQTLLLSSGWPFLVIEPAKTEYRGLRFPHVDADGKERKALCPDLLVFTLGDDTVAPFRLNPFELIPGESVTARVDMLMASITAAFDMEAAIPQLIERAIYACYEDYGWSVDDNVNAQFEDPFADGVFAFPTLSDVLRKTEIVVNEQGFDERLKKDYIGSINARLQGLTLGAKGFMLDCPRSVDFMKLLDRQVVLELEPIPNAAQKSLIIGFVLTNLLQAVKRKFQTTNAKVKHITLIEEAHRLLSKPEPGCNPSQRQAAETFADMLAEIRKYGESLVIADQIPGKLTPEVMKNTNTKIIHRLFAQDDKEAVGHTMGLEREQAQFLSNLQVGRAVVFNGNWPRAVQVQISQTFRTDAKIPKDEAKILREAALAFYAGDFARGVFGSSHLLKKRPSAAELATHADAMRELTKKFRSGVVDRPAKRWSPQTVPLICQTFGPEAIHAILSKEALEELDFLTDNKIGPEKWKLDAIVKLSKKLTKSAVWTVLASHEFGWQMSRKAEQDFSVMLDMFVRANAKELADKNSEVCKDLVELRKKFRNALNNK